MNEVAERKRIIHQGRNVKITRESKGLYQQDLADKLNKQQSDISKIENKEIIEDELLKQIALALEVPVDFLKNFNLDEHVKSYYNHSTNTFTETSHDNEVNQGDQYYYFSVEEFTELNDRFLKLQKELLEEKHELDKENALLKQELEFLKNRK